MNSSTNDLKDQLKDLIEQILIQASNNDYDCEPVPLQLQGLAIQSQVNGGDFEASIEDSINGTKIKMFGYVGKHGANLVLDFAGDPSISFSKSDDNSAYLWVPSRRARFKLHQLFGLLYSATADSEDV